MWLSTQVLVSSISRVLLVRLMEVWCINAAGVWTQADGLRGKPKGFGKGKSKQAGCLDFLLTTCVH